MDQRVFGPYYGTPPEARTQPSNTEEKFSEPIQPTRTSLRARLLTGRRRRTHTRP